jgi:uncharacterized protein YoxC
MPQLETETLLLAFVALAGVAMLLQAVILLAIFLSMRKASRSIKEQLDDLRSSVVPVIDDTRAVLAKTRDLLAHVAPRIEAVSADLAEITHGLRVQTAEMQSSVDEIMERVRRQSNRVDSMFSTVLDGVEKAGGFVVGALNRPVRQISAVLASIKAVVEALRAPTKEEQPAHTSATDKDMFV